MLAECARATLNIRGLGRRGFSSAFSLSLLMSSRSFSSVPDILNAGLALSPAPTGASGMATEKAARSSSGRRHGLMVVLSPGPLPEWGLQGIDFSLQAATKRAFRSITFGQGP